jgi:hypothetical protein
MSARIALRLSGRRRGIVDSIRETFIPGTCGLGPHDGPLPSRREFNDATDNKYNKQSDGGKNMAKIIETLSQPLLAHHIQSHIIGSDITKAIKEWDVTVKESPRNPIWAWIEDTLIGQWQNMIGSFVRTRVEEGFDVEEWLEGAKDAFWAVHRFGNTEEYKLLKPMMSDALYLANESIYKDFKNKGLTYVSKDTFEEEGGIDARLCGIQFFSKSDIDEYCRSSDSSSGSGSDSSSRDENNGTEQGNDPMSGKWMVLSVEFRSKCSVDIIRDTTGEMVSNVVDSSPKMYKFFTGPLPSRLPCSQLETPWRLLSYA